MLLYRRAASRWMIFIVDLFIVLFSLTLAYLLRFNFASIPQSEINTFPLVFSLVMGFRTISFLVTRTHQSIIRYTSSKDVQRIFVATASTSLLFGVINLTSYFLYNKAFAIPFSIIIIEFMATTFLMIGLRLIFKAVYLELKNPSSTKTNVIIFGAGESGIITKRTLDRDAGIKYKVLAFIDDDSNKWGMTLEGIPISGQEKLHELLATGGKTHLIISIQNINPKRKEEIIETCLKYKTKILNVPPVSSWINGELSFRQIKKIKIEDLLERNIIQLDQENIREQILHKIILVTGAAGSIGSEIVRQIATFNPRQIILLDTAESPLYELELELRNSFPQRNFEFVIADIRNLKRMEHIFMKYEPNLIYHAAAYKHVPLMEFHPLEAIHTNVEGTKILADLSVKHHVDKFVMVSSDKAVNPTNVMGASKRIAEMYVQASNAKSDTRFVTTRFGNVLGSNGSVIELFKQQIEKGGPITVTHPDITRFFMTIPEACQLVLEAGAMGNGGEIYLFDMGKSVRIVDLAKKMIQLAGLTIDKDISIIYTGLRPGEKLFEELLANKEKSMPTYNPQIMVGQVQHYDTGIAIKKINELIEKVHTQNSYAVVHKMKEIVPEFKSRNSIFEELDTISLS